MILRASLVAFLACVSISIAACGGSVVFVEDDDGAGGSTTSTSSNQPTSGKTTGVVTTGPGTTNVVTTVGPTTVGVTTGPGPEPICAFAEITETCNDCLLEAQVGPLCEIPVNDCLSTEECFDYGDCAFNCNGAQACCNDCAADNPFGAKLYTDAVYCMVCQVCPMECFGAVPGLCQ